MNEVNKTLIEIFESATMDDGQGGEESLFLPDKSDINYEFEDFHRPDPTVTGCWYELHFLPAQPVMAELGRTAMNEWNGIFLTVESHVHMRGLVIIGGLQEHVSAVHLGRQPSIVHLGG